jgi:hypothetical protein
MGSWFERIPLGRSAPGSNRLVHCVCFRRHSGPVMGRLRPAGRDPKRSFTSAHLSKFLATAGSTLAARSRLRSRVNLVPSRRRTPCLVVCRADPARGEDLPSLQRVPEPTLPQARALFHGRPRGQPLVSLGEGYGVVPLCLRGQPAQPHAARDDPEHQIERRAQVEP